jgi:hypothetical protein
MSDRLRGYIPWIAVSAAAVLFFLGLSRCMSGLWGFDFFHPGGDVYAYWTESLTWGMPFHPHHPPGYPWLIALANTLSAGRLPPLAIMQSLSFSFLLGGAFLGMVLCRKEGIAYNGWKVALLYIAWPFVGSLYAVFPQMDSIVLFLLILGIVLGLYRRWIPAGIAWGAAAIVHPLAWIFVPLLLSASWAVRVWGRKRPPAADGLAAAKEMILMTGSALAPWLGIWLWQTVLTADPFWTLTSIVNEQVASRGLFPILDGWIGSVADGGMSGWVKIGILSLVVLLAVHLLTGALRRRTAVECAGDRFRRIVSIVLTSGILLMALLLNQHEIWAVVRFSKILVLPIVLQRDRLFGFVPPRLRMPALWALIIAGFLSQIAYAWYMSTIFFGA